MLPDQSESGEKPGAPARCSTRRGPLMILEKRSEEKREAARCCVERRMLLCGAVKKRRNSLPRF